ncbi:hypothetical protein T11_9962, partial [Trichinella zimbabwensis]
LPIGGSRGSTAGLLTLALYIGPEIVPSSRRLESSSKSQSKDRLSWLERRVRQHWLAVFVIFGRDEVEVLDEPSRSAYGRTIERESLVRTVVEAFGLPLGNNGSSSGSYTSSIGSRNVSW